MYARQTGPPFGDSETRPGRFDDELAVLSGSTDNVVLLDEIMAEVGDDPKAWLPIFHERRKAGRTLAQTEFQ